MSMIRRFTAASMLAMLFFAPGADAQSSAGAATGVSAAAAADPVAHVLVLGTYHFANPGLDVVQTDVVDVLSAARQAEILSIVETLARFRPTKIAVEHVPAAAPRLDSIYGEYRTGRNELDPDETQQLGFRLAAMLEHPRVYPIDYRGEFPFGAVMEYAALHDPVFVSFFQQEIARITAEANRQQKENTVAEILRLMNDPASLHQDHGAYVRFAQVGARDGYVGAALLSKWYERNIYMFANIREMVEPGDRILVIVGGGHAPILRELITYDPHLLLVDVLDYLPAR